MSIVKGTFTSIWTEGSVTTDCTLNTETGELFPETTDVGDLGSLESEKFEGEDGSDCEYEVCLVCHDHIMVGKMFPDQVGKGMHERQVCSNLDCESHETE
jgi:hypothetical protein